MIAVSVRFLNEWLRVRAADARRIDEVEEVVSFSAAGLSIASPDAAAVPV
jgi:hypothetical protein